MSKISLSPNVAGTATFEIAAPNSNTNRTLTLPDSTGTILNDQSNIEAQTKTALSAIGSAPVFGCRAWVNFDGTRNAAGTTDSSNTNRFIRASGNVASVLKNGTGDYTVSFTTAMPDANYCYSLSGQYDQTGSGANTAVTAARVVNYATTSSIRVLSFATSSGNLLDFMAVTVSIFR